MDSLSLFHRFTNRQGPAPLVEAWGDVVPTYDSGWWDESGGVGSRLAHYQRPATTLSDRNDGRFLPVYQTEFDLAVIRAMGRTLACVAPGLVGGMRNLCNYTIGEGFTFTVTREATAEIGDEEAGPLVKAIQFEVNSLLDDNEFVSGLDREIHDCSIVDGESLLHVRPNAAGKVRIYRREPDELRQPANTRELEEWVQDSYGIDCESFVSSWSFGVHTRADEPDMPLGYHLVSDESGVNWEYVPADRMVHIKRNVTRNAKRGFSDFYPVEPDSARGEKLRRNMAEGAAVQSAIAFVRQHVAGTTRVGVEAMLGDNKAGTSRQSTGFGGSRTRSVVQYQPGTVVDLSAGLEYKAGPLGSERAADFLLVAAYVQRMQAVRWSMPEYMFSGDASNANYASTMEATAPFVKSCEAEQRFYSKHFVSLLWKALKIRWEMGAFDQFDIAWEDLVAWFKIQAECPEVATRDELQNVQRQEILIKLGILSRKTAATQNGLDYEAEVANGAAPEGQEGKGGAAPGGPGPGAPLEGVEPTGPAASPEASAPCECDKPATGTGLEGPLGADGEESRRVQSTSAPKRARKKRVTESVLFECGGKGGKPGPCPTGIKKTKKGRPKAAPKPARTTRRKSTRKTSKADDEPSDDLGNQTAKKEIADSSESFPHDPSRAKVPASVPPKTPKPEATAERAKAPKKLVNKDVQRHCEEHNEAELAEKIGGERTPGGYPVDVLFTDPDTGRKHGLELKTLVQNSTGRIRMEREALVKKRAWRRKEKGRGHTIVFDDREVYDAFGPGKHDYSKRKIYYRRGFGGFSTSSMHEVTGGYEELLALIKTKSRRTLPKGAR